MTYRVGEEVEVKRGAAPPSFWYGKHGSDFVPAQVRKVNCGDPGHPCSLLDFDGYAWYVWHENIRRLARTPFEERVYAYIERELSS